MLVIVPAPAGIPVLVIMLVLVPMRVVMVFMPSAEE
jgi:hypothetical protein